MNDVGFVWRNETGSTLPSKCEATSSKASQGCCRLTTAVANERSQALVARYLLAAQESFTFSAADGADALQVASHSGDLVQSGPAALERLGKCASVSSLSLPLNVKRIF
jgi:hypothetical protein